MNEPSWLPIARKHLGLTEIPGKATHPTIRRWLIDLKAWWQDDETPWCGTFVAAVMKEAGYALPKHWYRAREWATWGTSQAVPRLGSIVVFQRQGGGHVGFVVGHDEQGRLMVLGGNQANSVNIQPFVRDRVLAYRWPPGAPHQSFDMPVIQSGGRAASRNEA
jgi:uncharacterized protein (TIGR02594 family)